GPGVAGARSARSGHRWFAGGFAGRRVVADRHRDRDPVRRPSRARRSDPWCVGPPRAVGALLAGAPLAELDGSAAALAVTGLVPAGNRREIARALEEGGAMRHGTRPIGRSY